MWSVSPAAARSTSSSTSTSNGCGRPCSSGSTPWIPSSRRPAMRILSIAVSYPIDTTAVRSSLRLLAPNRRRLLRLAGCLRLRGRLGRRWERLGRRTRRAEETLVHRDGDDLPADRTELAARQLLQNHDGVRSFVHEP